MRENAKPIVVSVKLSARTCAHIGGINRGLSGLAMMAEDAVDLREILETALMSLYQTLPPKGLQNYGLDDGAKIGRFSLDDHATLNGKLGLVYSPSNGQREQLGYLKAEIAELDLRRRTYHLKKQEVPDELMKDTVEVLNAIGLKKTRARTSDKV